jgi:hypothetical protein
MMKTFKEAWAEKEREGYQYGGDALENVEFGWEIAQAEMRDAEASAWNEGIEVCAAYLEMGAVKSETSRLFGLARDLRSLKRPIIK